MLSPDQSASKIEKRKAIGENEETTRGRGRSMIRMRKIRGGRDLEREISGNSAKRIFTEKKMREREKSDRGWKRA